MRTEPPMPYRSIEDPARLRRVLEATLLLEADLEMPILLRHVVDEALSITNARYGAIGVLNDDHSALVEFIAAGLSPDEERRIGARPTGRGVLGLLIADPKPLRMSRIGAHPDSFGFPPHHPPMKSFLGVPIRVREEVYGILYLTDKVGWSEFTDDDEALVGALVRSAGIVIENTRLHRRVQETAIYDERDRLARDLHDTVIQRLFAVGLTIQSVAGTVTAPEVADRLKGAIADIDDTIRQVRTTIFELGLEKDSKGARANIIALVHELSPVVGFEIGLSIDGPLDTALSDEVEEHLLATLREALTNVGRHANATQASVLVTVDKESCRLRVLDNGQGTDAGKGSTRGGGLGLVNMRRRAEKLQGGVEIETPETGGTLVIWQVPTRIV
jgi:two-component system, NarL family, sensor histidine kinase DevS